MGDLFLILCALAGASWIAYAAFARKVSARLQAVNSSHPPAGDVSVELTVLIPCRNEAEALPHVLSDLQAQSLPVRIVVIDDASTDGTCDVARNVGVTCIPAEGSGKKAALATGFERVKTPWIATVDADVRLGKEWARNMLATAVHQNAACVLGGVVIEATPPTGWNRFQQLEFAVMQVWIAGGVESRRLAMGSGANSVYATEAYPVDALRPEWASGDDAFALFALRQRGKSIRWCGHVEARVSTTAVPNWRTLWQQRARWASKTGGQDTETRLTALTIAALHGVFLALAIWAVADGSRDGWLMLAAFTAAKTWIDWRLLATACRAFGLAWRTDDALLFPFRYAFLVWGAWWQLLRGGVHWKGRPI